MPLVVECHDVFLTLIELYMCGSGIACRHGRITFCCIEESPHRMFQAFPLVAPVFDVMVPAFRFGGGAV